MSKVYFDHLFDFGKLEIVVREVCETHHEREELWKIVDQIVHQEVHNFLLKHLEQEHHEEFAKMLHECPHDLKIISFINEKTKMDMEKELGRHLSTIEESILNSLSKDT